MTGWIKIHREITEHWIFQDAEKFKWWIDLLIMASHEDNRVLLKDNLVSLKRGQLSISLSFLSTRWGRSKEKVLNFLRLLESDHMIERYSDRKSTTITICNYDSYQDGSEQVPTTERTTFRPLSDQSPTEYKNVEECKEINNNISNAHTREEKVAWVRDWEESLQERFKAQGCGMAVARATGLKAADIYQLLDVFMAKCELSNLGHRDLEHFNNRFLKAIQNKRLSLPQQEQSAQQKKVTSNEDTYRLMHEMGWQN